MSEPAKPSTKPVVNPTPKQILLADGKLLSNHRDLMQNPLLMRSIELAQAQYVRLLTERGAIDGFSSASNFHRISGMNEFVAILKSLGETSNLPTPANPDKINHTV